MTEPSGTHESSRVDRAGDDVLAERARREQRWGQVIRGFQIAAGLAFYTWFMVDFFTATEFRCRAFNDFGDCLDSYYVHVHHSAADIAWRAIEGLVVGAVSGYLAGAALAVVLGLVGVAGISAWNALRPTRLLEALRPRRHRR